MAPRRRLRRVHTPGARRRRTCVHARLRRKRCAAGGAPSVALRTPRRETTAARAKPAEGTANCGMPRGTAGASPRRDARPRAPSRPTAGASSETRDSRVQEVLARATLVPRSGPHRGASLRRDDEALALVLEPAPDDAGQVTAPRSRPVGVVCVRWSATVSENRTPPGNDTGSSGAAHAFDCQRASIEWHPLMSSPSLLHEGVIALVRDNPAFGGSRGGPASRSIWATG